MPARRLSKRPPGSALVDGKYGFGHIAAAFATDVAVRKAKEAKAVVVGVVRCNHIGRLGEWGSRAAKRDVIAIVTVGGGGTGAAAPFGGAARALSTNPISVGIPGGETPDMLVDFATTVVAEGKIQVARAKGVACPAVSSTGTATPARIRKTSTTAASCFPSAATRAMGSR